MVASDAGCAGGRWRSDKVAASGVLMVVVVMVLLAVSVVGRGGRRGDVAFLWWLQVDWTGRRVRKAAVGDAIVAEARECVVSTRWIKCNTQWCGSPTVMEYN